MFTLPARIFAMQGIFVFNRRHHRSLFTRINSDAGKSRACGKTNCRSVAYNTSFTIMIDQSRTLLLSTLSFIALAMQRRSGAAAQMVFRDIVSSYLTSLARVTVQTRLRITRTRVRMVGRRTESRGWERGREGDGFSLGGTSSAT